MDRSAPQKGEIYHHSTPVNRVARRWRKKRRKISYLEMENEQDLLIFPWGTNVSRLGDLTAPQTTTGRQWSHDQPARKWHSLSLAARLHAGTTTRSWTRNLPAGGASVGPAHAAGGRGGVFNCRSTVNAITREQTEPPRPCAGWNIRGARIPWGGNDEIPLFPVETDRTIHTS